MSQQNSEQEDKSNLSNFEPEDILATLDGIPLPPAIKKNLWKSIGRLITGLVDVPVAHLEAKVQKIRSEANGLSLVTKSASEAVAKEFGKDKHLIDRSISHFGSKLLREQINRESIVDKAANELKNDPPIEDSKKEIDEDWLEMFSRVAETKSNEDIQLFLAKILAGEIRKPGTFGPRTIQTLSLLDQSTAKVFQSFCNVSFEIPQVSDSMTCVICEPFGSPGNNGLSPVGLPYSNLTRLQDAGLIQHDLNAWKQFPVQLFQLPVRVGSTNFIFRLTEQTPQDIQQVRIINFTAVGLELRKVLHIESNTTYNEKFLEWILNKWKLVPVK